MTSPLATAPATPTSPHIDSPAPGHLIALAATMFAVFFSVWWSNLLTEISLHHGSPAQGAMTTTDTDIDAASATAAGLYNLLYAIDNKGGRQMQPATRRAFVRNLSLLATQMDMLNAAIQTTTDRASDYKGELGKLSNILDMSQAIDGNLDAWKTLPLPVVEAQLAQTREQFSQMKQKLRFVHKQQSAADDTAFSSWTSTTSVFYATLFVVILAGHAILTISNGQFREGRSRSLMTVGLDNIMPILASILVILVSALIIDDIGSRFELKSPILSQGHWLIVEWVGATWVLSASLMTIVTVKERLRQRRERRTREAPHE